MQFRDYWALLLTILSAPFFIFIYYAMTGGGSTTYSVSYRFEGMEMHTDYGKKIINELETLSYADGKPYLKLKEVVDEEIALKALENRKTDLLLIVPEGFSDSLKNHKVPVFEVYGEAGNPKYSLAVIFTITGIETMIRRETDNKPLFIFDEKLVGNSQAKSEFDIYAPGIFIFSIIMLILSASLAIIRDVEDKTMLRLKLSKMTVFNYLIGNTFVQWIIGVVSFAITYGLAILLGFNSVGSTLLVLLVCSLTILSIIAICLILVAFCRNATMIMIVGNFPLFVLMFFTGAMMPLPRRELFQGFAINDILPPTHSVNALNKIFTYGCTLKDISGDLAYLTILTVIYFSLGIYLFHRRHIRLI